MGRTLRHRKRKLVTDSRPISLESDDDYVRLLKWLKRQRWEPTCKLAPARFNDTGRGMIAKEDIAARTILASLPADVLITVRTVANSELSRVFVVGDKSFSTQQVLSSFLVWEKHRGSDSFWFPYLRILPERYFSPVFSPDRLDDAFPPHISAKIRSMKSQIGALYSSLVDALGGNRCQHCDLPYADIFTFDTFKWAWFTVNSRSVYISPTVNDSCNVKLTDSNSIALAPFLDMINHTDEAEVNVLYDEKKSLYSILTLVPYKKSQEVFINYGGHSNEKLYLEYGFVLQTNRNDCVSFTHDEIIQSVKPLVQNSTPKSRYNFLKSHGFFSNLNCHHGGLSWNAKVLIYALLEPATVEIGDLLRNIYSSSFGLPSKEVMNEIICSLFSPRIALLNKCIERLKMSERGCSATLATGVDLMKKHIDILEGNMTLA